MNAAVRSWVTDVEALDDAFSSCVLRRISGRARSTDCRMPCVRRADRAEPAEASRLLSPSQRAARCRPHGTSHVCQHDGARRRRSHQQLDVAGGRAREADAAVRRLHARAHHVRGAVPDGPSRIAVFEGRRRDHRQPLRRPEHAHHDARRTGRARSPRRF